MNFILEHWGKLNDLLTLALLVVSILVGAGLFWGGTKTAKSKNKLKKQLQKFRIENALQKVTLDKVDPERFIERATAHGDHGDFQRAEEAATKFLDAQKEAVGLAAEILTEQRILDSGEHGEWAVEEAQRFAIIGLAANPDSARLKELQNLAETRAEGVGRGEPLETLNWDGMSDVELNRLSLSLMKAGHYQLAEIAARRSVPLAMLRTGEKSNNFSAVISQHAETLGKLGLYSEAEGLYRQALDIAKATLGVEDPGYAIHLNNLANVLESLGRHGEAEELYHQALEIDKTTIGVEDPQFANHLSNLAVFYYERQRFQDALPLMKQALAIWDKVLGAEHPKTVNSRNDLATIKAALDP